MLKVVLQAVELQVVFSFSHIAPKFDLAFVKYVMTLKYIVFLDKLEGLPNFKTW